MQGNLPGREVLPYIEIQVVGAFAGVAAAHGMFSEPLSSRRSTPGPVLRSGGASAWRRSA